MKQMLIQRLRAEGCSCVIQNGDTTLTFHQRGVKDLHNLLRNEPSTLRGALLADKVVGKGAAVLMVAGGVEWVYAEVISESALELLSGHNIPTDYGKVVATSSTARAQTSAPWRNYAFSALQSSRACGR